VYIVIKNRRGNPSKQTVVRRGHGWGIGHLHGFRVYLAPMLCQCRVWDPSVSCIIFNNVLTRQPDFDVYLIYKFIAASPFYCFEL